MQRDTGRSTSYPHGSPRYTGTDLVSDAIAVLDGIGIGRAHVVGFSMGGGVAHRMAIENPNRVATLTLISTSPIGPEIQNLPGPAPEVLAMFSSKQPEPDWTDRRAVSDYVIEGERPYAGSRNVDELRLRIRAGRIFDRTNDMGASLTNHFLLDSESCEGHRLDQLAGVPTLVFHGTADPLFPFHTEGRLRITSSEHALLRSKGWVTNFLHRTPGI